MNRVSRMTLLYFAVFASALMIMTLLITAALGGESTDTPAFFAESQSHDDYWLRSYNGHIAVYSNKIDDVPTIETTINVEGLRVVDKELLDKGIKAETYEDVLKLLEDFGS